MLSAFTWYRCVVTRKTTPAQSLIRHWVFSISYLQHWPRLGLDYQIKPTPKLPVLFSVCGSGCVSRLGPVPQAEGGFGNPSKKNQGSNFWSVSQLHRFTVSYASYAPWKWWINASTKAAVAATPATANCERPSRLSASTCEGWGKHCLRCLV